MTADTVIIGSSGANLASLTFALQRLNCNAVVSEDPDVVARAKRVILPGVGAAADAMARLREARLDTVIPKLQQPLLGICLGMQLLFERSEEDDAECLNIIAAPVRRLKVDQGLPVPHMGWNELDRLSACPLLDDIAPGSFAYFVHSFAAPPGPYTRAETNYGVSFTSVVQHENFFGTQFHPERSAKSGAIVLSNFLKLS